MRGSHARRSPLGASREFTADSHGSLALIVNRHATGGGHMIVNCAQVCPKGLNPAKAIAEIKAMLADRVI